MSQDYCERDKLHNYNKHFYKYCPDFECPKLDRPCQHYLWLIMLILMVIWMVALPIYITIKRNSIPISPILQDFRGDFCGITFANRSFIDIITQINAKVCSEDCQTSNFCIYRPNGIDLYADWCFQRTTSSIKPIQGMCNPDKFDIDKVKYCFQQLNKGYQYLYINIGGSVLAALFWITITILFASCRNLKILIFINLTSIFGICGFGIFLMVNEERLDKILYPTKLILFIFVVLVSFTKWLRILINIKKSLSLSRLTQQILPELRIKAKIFGIYIFCFILTILVCLSHVYIITNFASTFQLNIVDQPTFPGGKIKIYSYSQLDFALIIAYILSSIIFLNFLNYLKQSTIAMSYEVQYFQKSIKRKNRKIFINTIKDLGLLYKVSIILELVSIFNLMCRWMQIIANLPVIKHILQQFNASMQETYQYNTKYIGKWYVSQRAFQAEQISQGGQIVYYLVQRNYPEESFNYIRQMTFTDSAWGCFVLPTWIAIWVLLHFQTDQQSFTFISLHYLFAFICFIHNYILAYCSTTTIDQCLRVLLYCAAANKEMKYVSRSHHTRIMEILINNQEKKELGKVFGNRNIFDTGEENMVEKELDNQEQIPEVNFREQQQQESQVTFRNMSKDNPKIVKQKIDQQSGRLYYTRKHEKKLAKPKKR